MSGKPVDLEARVPKAMRKAARAEAKRRGLDVDTVVTDLLNAWLTDRTRAANCPSNVRAA